MALLQRSRLAAPSLWRCRGQVQSTVRRYNSVAAASSVSQRDGRSPSLSLSISHSKTSTALHNASPTAVMARPYSTASEEMYTASFAFFEAIWDAGITHCFVNLGTDHPSIIEAMVKGQREAKGKFPKIITCPNEHAQMVAMSMADGYARLTGKPQCVIVHVDVGTQGLGAAVHNASTGRAPVLVFAGLSPFTQEGEHRGSRTEYIHWIQDVPDQKQIVSQYCRYTGEIKTGANVKQMVNRALQFAASDPKGPADARYKADALTAVEQISASLNKKEYASKLEANAAETEKQRSEVYENKLATIEKAAEPLADDTFGTGHLSKKLRDMCPEDTIWAIEAVTNTGFVHDNVRPTIPGSWLNCGGGGLGWSGGGALGIKLATDAENGGTNKGKFVVQIVGDGTYLFTVPGSVYWISRRYKIPVLTIVLNNKGWNAPRRSLLLVHPDGLGSKATNEEINISFDPVPDYAGIAKAAAGGDIHAARVDKASELESVLKEAIAKVQAGQTAVVDVKVAPDC
ncbi:thiamine pyrophosphate enzyme N-terminal TPP binding domain-containing protein [Fusarium acuminatum]|uniref:Thiamine pyrophosphate enzyme N-terminal TPP binding domain-containing protein n=1 Tax=Fusarium acuminatum TaxID=5515 RepID=A0ABZ2WUN6_9HYPO